jgi:nitrite reductase (NO-forming)
VAGGGWWLPLHLALGGGAGLAIAALLPHFLVSLAGAHPAPARVRAGGLLLVGGGVIVVAVAFPSGWAGIAIIGASAYVSGLVTTAATALVPARSGLGRRFGVVEAAYGLALVNASIAAGVAMLRLAGAAELGGAWLALKPAHAWLNLVGFVSLMIAATLIHLYPTVLGSRIRSRSALVVLVAGIGLGAPVTALGFALAADAVARLGAGMLAAGAAALGLVAIGSWSGRGRWTTDPDWHRLTIGHLSAAAAWFMVGAVTLVVSVAVDGAAPRAWSLPLVAGSLGVGWALQALVGAWSHLLPSVGPGDAARHAAQRHELGRWALLRLIGWNVATALLVAGVLGLDWAPPAGLSLLGVTLVAAAWVMGRALFVCTPR